MSIEELKQALAAAYLAGFNASGEGYNSEYPFRDKNYSPTEEPKWLEDRATYVDQAIAEVEKQERDAPELCKCNVAPRPLTYYQGETK